MCHFVTNENMLQGIDELHCRVLVDEDAHLGTPARRCLVRVELADVGDVTAEDGGVEGSGLRQVVRNEQELAPGEPRVMFGGDVGEALLAAGLRVSLEDGVQDGHEMALTGAEGSVEAGGPRALRIKRRLDQAESLIEVPGQGAGDDVIGDRRLLPDALESSRTP
jgi:hypothetical protein